MCIFLSFLGTLHFKVDDHYFNSIVILLRLLAEKLQKSDGIMVNGKYFYGVMVIRILT